MNEYFANNDFDLEEPIFNIEFQMNRGHLKQFNIYSIDDLLSNANNLFKEAMEDIRLLNVDSVSSERLVNNKYQAQTHPIWEEVKNEYDLKEFLQVDFPLERLKRKISVYDDNKFEYEFIALLRKAFINNLNLDSNYIDDLYKKAKDSLTKTTTEKEMKKDYIEVDVVDTKTNETVSYRLLKSGELIKPLRVETVANLSDYDLLCYMDKTKEKKHLSSKDRHIDYVAHKEARKRNLILDITPDEAIDF
jgi:hypothetical protein